MFPPLPETCEPGRETQAADEERKRTSRPAPRLSKVDSRQLKPKPTINAGEVCETSPAFFFAVRSASPATLQVTAGERPEATTGTNTGIRTNKATGAG